MKTKFRVWDKIFNKMFYSGTLDNGDMIAIDINGELILSDDDTYKVEDFVLMQGTKITTSTGEEVCVFEGDIIPYHFNENVIGIVKFGPYDNNTDDCHGGHVGFYVDWKNDDYRRQFRKDIRYWVNVSKIIGNIYENPDKKGG